MHSRPHEKLIVWQRAYQLCLAIYRLTSDFPSYERFGLTSQMRRSAASVPLNLAEGNAKRTKPERMRYIDIATGSLEELHCQLRLCKDLEYISFANFSGLADKINRVSFLLMRLHTSLR